jgi:hypothetical protein
MKSFTNYQQNHCACMVSGPSPLRLQLVLARLDLLFTRVETMAISFAPELSPVAPARRRQDSFTLFKAG